MMSELSLDALNRAVRYIREQARPLERALFAYEFGEAGVDDVLRELATYQNGDGGFAALGSDFGSDVSSVLNTTHALRTLCEIGADASHDLVSGAMHYIIAAYEPAYTGWPLIPPHDNRAPHAPWWHYTEDFPAKCDYFRDNPRPEVLAYLYQFPVVGSAAIVQEVSDSVTERIPRLTELSVNSLSCYLRLYEAPAIPDRLHSLLGQHLPRIAQLSINQDRSTWHQYVAKPLDLIHSPDSILYGCFRDAVAENLQYEAEEQAADGAWDPNWNWGGEFPEAWETARHQSRGILTLDRLRLFRDCGCLPAGWVPA
jgi:hypothetical protein